MSEAPEEKASRDEIEQQAATWIWRWDRGLSAAEQDDFSAWLAKDSRHGIQFARHRTHWNRLDILADWRPEHSSRPNPDLLAPPQNRILRRLVPATVILAAAAALVLAFYLRAPSETKSNSYAVMAGTAASQRRLPDGSIVRLNRGAVIAVDFSPSERRIRLEQGEAHFTVTKNAARPFIVTTHGVNVRAVGTAFNVRLESGAVEVLVTEGRVQVRNDTESGSNSPDSPNSAVNTVQGAALIPVLEAQQRAVVSLLPATTPPQIAILTAGEIDRVLAWQQERLEFTAVPLSEIVEEFNRRNVVKLVVVDRDLASVRISAQFRSDNIDGFVRLLENGFGAEGVRTPDGKILIRKATVPHRPD